MLSGLSEEEVEFKEIISDLVELLRTGNVRTERPSRLMKALSTCDPSITGILFKIFRSGESGLESEIERYWENIRVLAGIIVKHYVCQDSFPLDLLKLLAPEIFALLRCSEIKIARLSADIVIQITKRYGMTVWSSLSPGIDLLQETRGLLHYANGVHYHLLQYMIEDILELVVEQNPDFIEILATICSKDHKLISLLHICYLQGNLFDWFIEREYWTPLQRSLADHSERAAELVSDLIEEENCTHVNEIMKLMAALVEYQELCTISYDVALAWTFYAVRKGMVVESGVTPFFEAFCWYLIQIKDAFLDDDVQNHFRGTMHAIPVEVLLPFLMQKLVLLEEDVVSLLSDGNELGNIAAIRHEEENTLDNISLLIVSKDRYLAARCMECWSAECPDKLSGFCISMFKVDYFGDWHIQEALIMTSGLIGQYAYSQFHDGILMACNLLCDNFQNPIIRSTCAFAISRFVNNYGHVSQISKGSLCDALFSGSSSESSMVEVYSLRGMLFVVRICLEENASKESALILEKIICFLVNFVQHASIPSFLLSMTIFEALFCDYPLGNAKGSFPWNFLIRKLELASDTLQKYSNCLIFGNILLVVEAAIAGQHDMDANYLESIIMITCRAIENYLSNSNEMDDEIYIRAVRLWLSVLQKFPNSKTIIPLELIRAVISQAIYSENDLKIKVIGPFLSSMFISPILSSILSDMNETYIPALMHLVGKSEATGDILQCLTQCSISSALSKRNVEQILDILCKYLDTASFLGELDIQVCSICISRLLNFLITTNLCYFTNTVTPAWNKRVHTIMKILCVVPNDEKKCESVQGILKYMLLGIIEMKPLVDDLILLLASFHEAIRNSMQLHTLSSKILNVIKNDSILEKEYSAVLQRRRLQKFEKYFDL